jgi:hypothetical protein
MGKRIKVIRHLPHTLLTHTQNFDCYGAFTLYIDHDILSARSRLADSLIRPPCPNHNLGHAGDFSGRRLELNLSTLKILTTALLRLVFCIEGAFICYMASISSIGIVLWLVDMMQVIFHVVGSLGDPSTSLLKLSSRHCPHTGPVQPLQVVETWKFSA